MNDYLRLKKSNCKNCYKCIRHCPVKAISFSEDQAQIVHEECILCGHCLIVCPQNAKEIRNDVANAKKLIESGAPVYVSLAPSFIANYEGHNIKAMEKALKQLGFHGAQETAVGATVVKKHYEEMVNKGTQDVIISSCCPTVNLLIQKHYPEALPYLAHVVSPMQAHCQIIKREHPEAKTVFIGPCLSKKEEAESYPGPVDCVLTFEELTEWLSEEGIVLESIPDENEKSKARLFPTTGGVLRTMEVKNKDYDLLAIDGIEKCMKAIEDILKGNISKCFIEMSACPGSCIEGPAMDKNHRSPIRNNSIVNRYAGREDFPVVMPEVKEREKNIPYIGLNKEMPGNKAIEDVLRKMGKTRPEQELNCGSCGYNTCREKAVAVLQGKADLSMCLPFLKEKAESFSDNIISNTPNGIVVLNESMEVQQINAAACHLLNIANKGEILGKQVVSILEPQVFFEVKETGKSSYNNRVYLSAQRRYVEQTVLYDKSYHIIIVIMRDITTEETERIKKEKISQKTIETADKVIEKQMRTVQEIASLLGEITAETKIALTNLKGSLRDE